MARLRVDPRGFAAAALVVAAAFLPLAVARAPAGSQDTTVLALSRVVLAEIEHHSTALAATAARLRALETLPDEVVERALAETAANYPGFGQLLCADDAGTILLARQAGSDTGTAPASNRALDPSPERRRAMAGARVTGEPWVAPGPDDVEMAVVVRPAVDGERGLYLAGDLSTRRLSDLLGEIEKRTGGRVALGLEAGGRVIYPPDRDVPAGWRSDLGHGLTLHVAFPRSAAASFPWIVASAIAAIGAVLMLLAFLRRTGAA